jgi:DNA repair photolyase
MPFEWSLNPYRGCEFACAYCYARYTHGYLGLDDPREFEKRIFAKEDLPHLLARDLDRRVAPGQRIAVGTATDPYQPLERTEETTRNCLRVFARREGLRISITTKSDLVVRDLDLLRVIAQRSSLHVNFSVPTVDRGLARALEPRAPTPQRRLLALRELAAEGIETGLFLMPVLPGLTDGPGMIEATAKAAAGAGARYLCHQVAFLREPTRAFWFDFLRANFPALVTRYRSLYASGAHAPSDLRESVARRVARARRAARLADAPTDRAPADPQLTLRFHD